MCEYFIDTCPSRLHGYSFKFYVNRDNASTYSEVPRDPDGKVSNPNIYRRWIRSNPVGRYATIIPYGAANGNSTEIKYFCTPEIIRIFQTIHTLLCIVRVRNTIFATKKKIYILFYCYFACTRPGFFFCSNNVLLCHGFSTKKQSKGEPPPPIIPPVQQIRQRYEIRSVILRSVADFGPSIGHHAWHMRATG